MNIESPKLEKVGFFRYKQLNGKYIITNDVGDFYFLDTNSFNFLLSGQHNRIPSEIYKDLENLGVIRTQHSFDRLARKYYLKNSFLGRGTSLHIVVLTLRCDHKCKYCHSSSKGLKAKSFDMNIDTARHVVDRIFESPSRNITIEFQGGEPLVNLETLKFIVGYAKKKNKQAEKKMNFTLVTNLAFMNKQILKYLFDNRITICTSLDGPENIHNKNRISLRGHNSYRNTVKWIKTIGKEYKKIFKVPSMGSLATITKFSLKYPRQIIDEYVRLGFTGIHLRQVSLFGKSKKVWRDVGYDTDEFIDFYKQSMDYIIQLNLKGKIFRERTANIFLIKILTEQDPGFLDIRSPCGAVIGQLAYYFNGDVYTCDEGRMLAAMGDDYFKVGNVTKDTYKVFLNSPVTKAMCIASYLNNLPACNYCVYNPYCGVCPLYNYFIDGNIFSQTSNNRTCRINSAILDYLFNKLQDIRIKKEVFEKWLEN